MLVSLTVGKVDAGVAVLLTEDKRLVRKDTLLQTRLFCCEGGSYRCPSLTRSIDRVSVHPPSTLHNLRLNSRHHSRAKSPCRAESASFIQRSPRAHPQQIWPRFPVCTKPALTRRNSDFCCSRMGPHTARDIQPEVTLTVQKQQQSGQHTSAFRHVQHKDQRPCS